MEPQDLNVERSIGRLEGKMDSLIKLVGELGNSLKEIAEGRLTKLEVQVATMETALRVSAKTTATRNAILWSLITSSVSGIAILLVVHFFG